MMVKICSNISKNILIESHSVEINDCIEENVEYVGQEVRGDEVWSDGNLRKCRNHCNRVPRAKYFSHHLLYETCGCFETVDSKNQMETVNSGKTECL